MAPTCICAFWMWRNARRSVADTPTLKLKLKLKTKRVAVRACHRVRVTHAKVVEGRSPTSPTLPLRTLIAILLLLLPEVVEGARPVAAVHLLEEKEKEKG